MVFKMRGQRVTKFLYLYRAGFINLIKFLYNTNYCSSTNLIKVAGQNNVCKCIRKYNIVGQIAKIKSKVDVRRIPYNVVRVKRREPGQRLWTR